MGKPELLAPAGDMERLRMAVLYGADAVYLAGTSFGMRSFAGNFSPEELPEAVAFAHALRAQLRGLKNDQATKPWLEDAEWQLTQSQPLSQRCDTLMLAMGRDLGECVQQKKIDPCLAVAMDNNFTRMTSAAASCERILNTPMPFSYALLLHRTAYMYCFLLPFGLVDTTGFMTPFVVAIVAYTFYGLDALGDELEEPFGLESNDLPLDTICRGIEISLSQSLGETNVPEPVKPVNYLLT